MCAWMWAGTCQYVWRHGGRLLWLARVMGRAGCFLSDLSLMEQSDEPITRHYLSHHPLLPSSSSAHAPPLCIHIFSSLHSLTSFLQLSFSKDVFNTHLSRNSHFLNASSDKLVNIKVGFINDVIATHHLLPQTAEPSHSFKSFIHMDRL